jgi:maltose-binding protein MalE
VKSLYKIQISRDKIRNHFHYDKWKYVLGILLAVFSWSMLVTITAPRTPADKKVDIYLVGGFMLEEQAAEYADTILADFPELLEVNIYNIELDGEMEYAGRQKLMVMLGSQSGDIYSFTKDEFENMVKTGAIMPLDDYPELLSYFTEEQLKEGTFTTEEDPTPRIYGIPISEVEPFNKKFFITENTFMGVMAYSQNKEKAIEVMKWIMEHKEEAKYEQRKQELEKLQEQQE